MAHPTLGRIPIREAIGAEPGAMRVHTPPKRGVAGQAVPLRVAGGAALKTLARRSTVLQEPLGLSGVERSIEASLRPKAAFAMTAAAEQLGVMTG